MTFSAIFATTGSTFIGRKSLRPVIMFFFGMGRITLFFQLGFYPWFSAFFTFYRRPHERDHV
jgi:hypothetical protein